MWFGARQIWFKSQLKSQLYSSTLWDPKQIFKILSLLILVCKIETWFLTSAGRKEKDV